MRGMMDKVFDVVCVLSVQVILTSSLSSLPPVPSRISLHKTLQKDFIKDLIAGVVVSVVAVPQGLAYSILANLPAVMGLYTSAIPPLVYGFLGTSRQLSVGPVALVSMFIPAIAVQVHMAHDPALRIAVACLSSIISGVSR